LSRLHLAMCACFVLLIVVDIANGGGAKSLLSTVFGYVPLVLIAPFAYALRRLDITATTVDRVIAGTIALACAGSAVQLGAFGIMRPGGLNLNAIPFGVVVAVWGVFQFARGLESGRSSRLWPLFFSAAAFIPILMTQSKLA